MSERELRARLEQLQGGIKRATEELRAGVTSAQQRELVELAASADAAEADALVAEERGRAVRGQLERLRDEVERKEQLALAAEAQRAVPLITILLALSTLVGAFVGAIRLITHPRTPELVMLTAAVGVAVTLPIAFLAKRRLMRPDPSWRAAGDVRAQVEKIVAVTPASDERPPPQSSSRNSSL